MLICIHYISFLDISNPLYISSQMSESSKPFVGYANGASRSTQNLSSAVWAIFALNNKLVSCRGICIGRLTNNIVEYSALIELLSNADRKSVV